MSISRTGSTSSTSQRNSIRETSNDVSTPKPTSTGAASTAKTAEAPQEKSPVDPARVADGRRAARRADAELEQRLQARFNTTNGVEAATSAQAAPGPNDILGRIETTGASAQTARQDGLQAGVDTSHQMAETDLPLLRANEQDFIDVARDRDLPPALLAAIASRESRGGAVLDGNGNGDNGNGFGIMQVDRRSHTPQGGAHSREHIEQAADILVDQLDQVRAAHPDWTEEQQLRGAVAAYNMGADDVQTIAGMDRGTTGDDYSADVIARAQYLATQGFGGAPAE